ncbi:hypothetical protein D3C81_1552300 [compost metagenome]
MAWASLSGLNASPFSRDTSKRTLAFLAVPRSAWISQYSSGMKARISRSRSTTSFTATDCTRPADRPRAILDHSNGETMYPTTRSRKRRACWALTRSMSSSPGCEKASWIAFLVISLNTTRL